MRHREMNLEKLAERGLARIIADLYCLGVLRHAAAYRPVVGGGCGIARISASNGNDTAQLLEYRFHTPETTACQHRNLLSRRVRQRRIDCRIRKVFDRYTT